MRPERSDPLHRRGQAAKDLAHVARDLGWQVCPGRRQTQRVLYGLDEPVHVPLGRQVRAESDQDGAADGLDHGAGGRHRVLRIGLNTPQGAVQFPFDGVKVEHGRLRQHLPHRTAVDPDTGQEGIAVAERDLQAVTLQVAVQMFDDSDLPLGLRRVVHRVRHPDDKAAEGLDAVRLGREFADERRDRRNARAASDAEIEVAILEKLYQLPARPVDADWGRGHVHPRAAGDHVNQGLLSSGGERRSVHAD